MKLLWLTGWYPNKTEPYTGDFLQRHAAAVALHHQVEVIHLVRDRDGIVTRDVLEETFQEGGLTERIIYYYIPRLPLSLAERLLSGLRYRKLYRAAITSYLAREGAPAGVHVQIAGKNGWLALWLKRRLGIPYVVSEQWTGYLPEAAIATGRPSIIPRWAWRQVMKNAAGVSVVSRYLGNALQALQPGLDFTVIPNVVNGLVFYPGQPPGGKRPFHFIHISTLGYQKNPEAILEAFSLVKQVQLPFQLSVFGPRRPDLERLAATLGLQNNVSFHAEVPQAELAEHMRGADALILYSRYETFGCVLIEANACGLPALVSDIPVHHETIAEGINGYFVRGENAVALADKIAGLIQQGPADNREAIAEAARERYNYERIAQLFDAFYERAAIVPGD